MNRIIGYGKFIVDFKGSYFKYYRNACKDDMKIVLFDLQIKNSGTENQTLHDLVFGKVNEEKENVTDWILTNGKRVSA